MTGSVNLSPSAGESPTKKILLGEFDEVKDDDENFYLNMGDELLLSRDSSKQKNEV